MSSVWISVSCDLGLQSRFADSKFPLAYRCRSGREQKHGYGEMRQ